jgi:hypothetical protein
LRNENGLEGEKKDLRKAQRRQGGKAARQLSRMGTSGAQIDKVH